MGQSQPLSLPNANQPPMLSAQFLNAQPVNNAEAVPAVPVAASRLATGVASGAAAGTQQIYIDNPQLMKEWSVDQLGKNECMDKNRTH